ncbi:MAG: tetratricopeptide repeat protein [Candidatus Krumholzibacteriia bacterium]
MTAVNDTAAADVIRAALDAGQAALAVGDLPTALRHFEDVVGAAADGTEGWGRLAAVYATLGEADRAEVCYGRILAACPGHTEALYNRGVVRMGLEKFDAAHDDFAAVAAQLPDDADARNNLAVAAFMRGHLAEARAELRRTLAAAPDHANALLNLCDVEIAAGQPDAALAACDAFLAGRHDDEVARRRFDLQAAATCRALAAARDLHAAAATA